MQPDKPRNNGSTPSHSAAPFPAVPQTSPSATAAAAAAAAAAASSSAAMSTARTPANRSVRSPKLEVSFLLNQAHSATPPSTAAHTAQARARPDHRLTPGASSSTQRRFKCDSCNATFAQSHDALKHKRTVHEKLRPYTCDICGKSFGEKGNLSKHKKSVHLNERPFSCEFCSSSFAFKDGLQRHRSLVHYDMRPFKCSKCGADFKQISQLRKHACAASGVRLP